MILVPNNGRLLNGYGSSLIVRSTWIRRDTTVVVVPTRNQSSHYVPGYHTMYLFASKRSLSVNPTRRAVGRPCLMGIARQRDWMDGHAKWAYRKGFQPNHISTAVATAFHVSAVVVSRVHVSVCRYSIYVDNRS